MSKPYILVVDDEPAIRALVKEILEDEGYEVDVAEGGPTSGRTIADTRRVDRLGGPFRGLESVHEAHAVVAHLAQHGVLARVDL